MKFMLDFLILVRYLLPPSQHIFMCGRVREALWGHHERDEAQGCRQQGWLSSGENGSRVSVWVALLLVKITVHPMAKVQCEKWKAAAYKAEWRLLGKGGVGVRQVGCEEQGPLLKLRNLWSIGNQRAVADPPAQRAWHWQKSKRCVEAQEPHIRMKGEVGEALLSSFITWELFFYFLPLKSSLLTNSSPALQQPRLFILSALFY